MQVIYPATGTRVIDDVSTMSQTVTLVPVTDNVRGLIIYSTYFGWTNLVLPSSMSAYLLSNVLAYHSIYDSTATGGPGPTVQRSALFQLPIQVEPNYSLELVIALSANASFRLSYSVCVRVL